MKKKRVILRSQSGLHARPVSLLVSLAQQFQSNILIEKEGNAVNGKSMLGVLSIAARDGEELTVIAEGSDEVAAIDAIEDLLFNRLINE